MLVSIGVLANFLGVSVVTIRRWEREGRIKQSARTFGNHRRFNLDHFRNQEDNKKVAVYARVSSNDQANDLNTQVLVLLKYCKDAGIKDPLVIKDIGSGLNFKKRGLNLLLELIRNQQIKTLILNHKDRLLRFGSELVFKLCKWYDVNIIFLNESETDFKLSLCDNVIELMTVFCAKLYGSRAHKNSKKLQQT